MDWENVLNAHRQQYGRTTFMCKDESERVFLINLIARELKEHTTNDIDLALGYACRTKGEKCDLKTILQCVEDNVGKV